MEFCASIVKQLTIRESFDRAVLEATKRAKIAPIKACLDSINAIERLLNFSGQQGMQDISIKRHVDRFDT